MTTTTDQPAIPDAPAVTRYALLSTKYLVPHPKNVRVDVGDVADLAASVKAQGVLQPLVVASVLPHQKSVRSRSPQYVVIAGHRRLAAAKVARLVEVPCIVREDLVEEVDQLQAMLVENGQRVDLTPVEEGDAYRALTIDYGVPVKDLAAKVGRSPQLVRGRITLAGSPESVRTRVIAGQVPMEQAIALAEFEDDAEEHEALSQLLGTGHWAWGLQSAKDARTAAKDWAKDARAAERSGARQIEKRPDGEYVVELEDLGEEAAEHAAESLAQTQQTQDDEPDDASDDAIVQASENARRHFGVETHATCPGHCVHVASPGRGQYGQRVAGLVVWACDQPGLHDNATGRQTPADGPADVEDAAAERTRQAEQARARREEQEDALAAAAKVRRRHLGADARMATEKAARAYLARRIAEETTRSGYATRSWPIADVLELTLPASRSTSDVQDWKAAETIRDEDQTARQDVVHQAIAGWELAELVGLLALAQNLTADADLETAQPWSWERRTPWLRVVAATGYAWSPVELDFLPEAMRAELDEAETAAAEAATS